MSIAAPTPTQCDWVRNVRSTIKESSVDFHQNKPWIYWRDMLLGVFIAYGAATVFVSAEPFSVIQIVAYIVAVLWLYRVGSLIHEVAHLGGHQMVSFKIAWNILVGVPTLTPSTFFTGNHRDHHTQRVYGTPEDPEYVTNICARGNLWNLVFYFMFVALFPLVVFLRFALAPLTFLTPSIRNFTLRKLSAFTFNWKYERPLARIDRKTFAALELFCWFRAISIPGAVLLGATEPSRMFLLYLLGASVVTLNQLRQLADHHFEGHGGQLTMSEHIQDSCNYVGRDPVTWLFFPFAIQYHALHHLFPSLPYHNLAQAHRYLMKELPPDSPYRKLEQPGWWSVARKLANKPRIAIESSSA